MSWSGIFKFLLGFLIAISLLVGSGVAVALYFVTKLTAPPPKPIFANDKPIAKPNPSPVANKPAPAPVPAVSPATNAAETVSAAQPEASPSPTETASPKPLEPGAYRARVTWRNGLIMRDSPGTDSQRIGGIGYNQQIVVVTESEDKRWIKVRIEENNEEGWVKAGNVERIESEQTQTATE
ncbi:MAG TPA: peptide-binding protein [Cyanobacteria bacterium UBA11369]|nr:peptide-binding protein [Cyanobacteria bacterium UBA11371]HBE36349.1 peptide-binding protein [Cyanobacteria bacterium UBA11368]HBE50854.1 peptide-binding protein [Cyanobacteria bacterium UBA11369]